MPNYLYKCPICNERTEQYCSFDRFDEFEPCCVKDEVPLKKIITSPYIAAAARPTNPGARNTVAMDTKQGEWDKDIAAVNQMKKEGIVPRKVDGSDKWLATAKDKIEIEHGQRYNNVEMVKEVDAEMKTPKPIEEVKSIAKHNKKVLSEL